MENRRLTSEDEHSVLSIHEPDPNLEVSATSPTDLSLTTSPKITINIQRHFSAEENASTRSSHNPASQPPHNRVKHLIGTCSETKKKYGRVRSWHSESMDTTKSDNNKNQASSTSRSRNLNSGSNSEFMANNSHLRGSYLDLDTSPSKTQLNDTGNSFKIRGKGRARHRSKTFDADVPVMTISNNRTIYTHGRPPWYNSDGEFKDAFLIGICGGSASGKTTVAKRIIEKLNMNWVVLLSMDCFYKDLNEEELELAAQNEWNFDAPHSFDLDMCVEMLQKLKKGMAIDCPQYDFTTHQRDPVSKPIYGANVIIFEGILSMCDPRMRDLMDLKIFVETDSDIRLARRLKRDMASRARDLKSVIAQYEKFVKPAYDTFIHPLIKFADIVIPRGGENVVAINLITQQIHKELNSRFTNIRAGLVKAHIGEALPDTLHVLKPSNQVQGIHTILRNKETSRDDFIFYSNRLMRLLFEFAFSKLPHENIYVDTPQKKIYQGSKFAGQGLCGVSILRAGETMENALFQVTRDIRLGKILIQTNHINSEPELHFLRLPSNISQEHVILMDATVATGAAAMMAIRILLDHGVQQENILLSSLLMAETGIHTVAYAYPKVKLITTAVDKELDENFHIVPGMGNFGDRYFGTDKIEDDLDTFNLSSEGFLGDC